MTRAGQLLARLGKFNLVGLLGAALQLLLLYVLTKCFHMSAVAATPAAVEIVVLHNFAWHERFTWRDRPLNSIRQRTARLWRFHAGNGLTSLLGNTALAYCLVERLKAPVLPSAIGAIVVCSLLNFFIADRWVYTAGVKPLSDHDRRFHLLPSRSRRCVRWTGRLRADDKAVWRLRTARCCWTLLAVSDDRDHSQDTR